MIAAMPHMSLMNDTMMWGMGFWSVLVTVLLLLAIAALIKYLIK
jgi:hypothetical protein